jgi:hypothetical protein
MKKIYILLILMSSICSAQNINFTIDSAVDNGSTITETIMIGADVYVLTVNHSGNEELDNLGGGDLIFFLSAIDPLTPHRLSITKNGDAVNFDLNSIDYDTLGAGFIALTNQDAAVISSATNYNVGAGTLTITNPANAIAITQINIIPADNDDLNDFGFHNINVDIATACDASFSYSAASSCVNGSDPIAIVTGDPGGAFSSSGGLSINASTGTIDVSASTPGTYTVTYTLSGTCSADVSVTVNALDDASFSYDAASYCADGVDPTPTVTGIAGGTFSSGAGLSINAATGVIDVSASTPNTYTVAYTTAGSCPNSSGVSVTVNALDDASFNYDTAAYCADDTDPIPTISGLAGGTFSSTAGLSIDASTGVIDVSASIQDTYIVTYTTAGVCPNSLSVGVVINACAPINDECTGAIAVICGETVTGSTVNATDSGNEISPDVFYSFTDTVLQDVTLSTCVNSDFDTIIRVFDDCPQTNQVAFNDQFCGNQSQVTFTAQPNTTYYIMIDGWDGYGGAPQSGDYQLDVTCVPNIPAPGNDLCSNPTALSLGVTLTGETTAGATDDSTSDLDDTTCDSFTFHSDVWYTFQAPLSEEANIATVITGTSDQANIAVYTSLDCTQLDADSIGCSVGSGGESLTLTGLTANATYYVRVWSDGVLPPAPPETGRVEGTFNITVSDATLSTSEIDNFQAFNYYPNPVKNELILEAQNTIAKVRVFNLLGQVVITDTPNVTSKNIDMTQLQAGAYFVEVTIGNTTKTIRIIRE